MPTDRELLHRYASEGDEAAFAELVRRHADLVYSVALRVANESQTAEDVTQGVFTKLARQARPLCGLTTLVGWLHATSRRLAINAVRGENRRRTREQEAFIMQNIIAAPDLRWEQLRPLLDEAVDRLREHDRQAVLLRFFKGLSYQELGEALGLSENTAQKRVDRALEKLRAHFARQGVTVSSALLATTLSINSVQAAPVGLVASVTTASLAGTTSGLTVGSILLMALYMSTKTKIILAAVVILAIASAIGFHLYAPTDQPNSPASTDSMGKASSPAVASVVLPKMPAKPSQVAAPVVPAVTTAPVQAAANVGSAVAPAVGQGNFQAGPIVAAPQADLKAAIAVGTHFLATQDILGLIKTLMPPEVLADEGKGGMTMEGYAQEISSKPDRLEKFSQLLEAFNAIEQQNLTPSMNDDQTRATYNFDPPIAGHKTIVFRKEDGLWYLDGT